MVRSHDKLLRHVLAFDAVTCTLMGAALLLAGHVLGDLLAIPPIVLRSPGAVLLLFAVGVGYVARRAEPTAPSTAAAALGQRPYELMARTAPRAAHRPAK